MTQDALKFFTAYVKGQLLLAFVLALVYSAGFGLVGLPYGYLIGFFTGLFSWVPFIGSLIGFSVAMVVVMFHFNWQLLLSVCGVYLAAQLLEGLLLAPRILGRTVGLGFWQSLAAVLIGAIIFPPWGAIIAIPVAGFAKFLLEKDKIKKLKS